MSKVTIDFGTTNTVAAVWREATSTPETIRLPGLSTPDVDGIPALIPSMLYVVDGAGDDVLVGHEVRAQGYDIHGDERFFSSFKRGIAASSRPLARVIDGARWHDAHAGEAFLNRVVKELLRSQGDSIEELVLTVPIQSFERYLKWLRDETTLVSEDNGLDIKQIRIIDESTAAALGYDVRVPGELIMVFDFGGGTLDVSLVQMPAADESGGVVLDPEGPAWANWQMADHVEARVIAKAGQVLGGDDIDHWLVMELLQRNDVRRSEVGDIYPRLKHAVEAAKIRLSTHESTEISVFDPDTYRTFQATVTRTQLEDLLDREDFYGAIQKAIDKVLLAARARGIFPEHIGAVLMVGGTSLIPSVRRMLRARFGSDRVFEHKPFEAVAHGALKLATGMGVDDFLYHSYGIRHLSPVTRQHEWEEIIPAGTRYPLEEPCSLILTASRDGQEALELIIGEVEESAGGLSEVMLGERAIFLVEGSFESRQIVPLNDEDGARTVARLDPPGKAGEDRVEVIFTVDKNRTLRVTVTDIKSKKTLLKDIPVVELS